MIVKIKLIYKNNTIIEEIFEEKHLKCIDVAYALAITLEKYEDRENDLESIDIKIYV
ncbi:MAG: hypothetical protein H0Z24_05785 [Thermosipho sp. (in: Bacteria)]|nr:hypothetical protein [Thermosipho sp. (in: thermotogales)]